MDVDEEMKINSSHRKLKIVYYFTLFYFCIPAIVTKIFILKTYVGKIFFEFYSRDIQHFENIASSDMCNGSGQWSKSKYLHLLFM